MDRPGGPVDRLVADADVTTFLNDRFEPRFVRPEEVALPGAATLVLDPRGCRMAGGRVDARNPQDWIAGVNAALSAPPLTAPPAPLPPVPGVADAHPLQTPCNPTPL